MLLHTATAVCPAAVIVLHERRMTCAGAFDGRGRTSFPAIEASARPRSVRAWWVYLMVGPLALRIGGDPGPEPSSRPPRPAPSGATTGNRPDTAAFPAGPPPAAPPSAPSTCASSRPRASLNSCGVMALTSVRPTRHSPSRTTKPYWAVMEMCSPNPLGPLAAYPCGHAYPDSGALSAPRFTRRDPRLSRRPGSGRGAAARCGSRRTNRSR